MPENLSPIEQETLLRWFMHKLRMEDRRELMTEYPMIYSRWHDWQGYKVVHYPESSHVGNTFARDTVPYPEVAKAHMAKLKADEEARREQPTG